MPFSGKPQRYTPPIWVYIPDEAQLEYAKQQRKESGQLREKLLGYQKDCGTRKDIDGARYFKDEAADLMKQYRGWEAVIAWIEGKEGMNDWRNDMVSKQIAPYVDRAFELLDLIGGSPGKP